MRKFGQILRFLIPVIALVALVVFMTGAGRRERARLEKNKAVIMRYDEEVWKKRNWDVADEIVASDYVRHTAGQPDLQGREALKQHITEIYTAWPDFDFTAEIMVAEGDKVAVRYRITGTHQGTAWGIPPTGNKTDFVSVLFHRIAGGKVVEDWVVDETAVLLQMGFKLVPPEE